MKKRLVLIALIFVALIFAIGTVGALDANTIGFGQFLIQEAIVILVVWLSFKSLNK